LIRIGEDSLADDLDRAGRVFGSCHEHDNSLPEIPIGRGLIDEILHRMLLPLFGSRSCAAEPLRRRVLQVSITVRKPETPEKPNQEPGQDRPEHDPLLKKIAAAYNGYRAALVKKASEIKQHLVTDPRTAVALLGTGGMDDVFVGGIKTASSVFCPESLAYLVGAYRSGDAQISEAERVSLAHLGAFAEGPA